MSVAQNTGIRKAVRQLLVAAVACTAVAGGAAFAVDSDSSAPVTPQTIAGVAEDNGWPVVPPKPTPTN
ncbi:hypothetical protein [Streptomyces tanashiensis]|uniref:hypothetical protein n=1 Tax=Streptomyces tanashiensis TaxID=67367 RepID=UPI00167538E0|nr:hypothetical protein [Streptomyces tanashiensis]GGS71626.1 hypothetical protein GCM10010222_11090 [Streptomyces tanashiensis]GGY59336.1 hypothetical protein GCM10010299_77180 [Streptomyces tanashiensis]